MARPRPEGTERDRPLVAPTRRVQRQANSLGSEVAAGQRDVDKPADPFDELELQRKKICAQLASKAQQSSWPEPHPREESWRCASASLGDFSQRVASVCFRKQSTGKRGAQEGGNEWKGTIMN